jgi:hypothetical protein
VATLFYLFNKIPAIKFSALISIFLASIWLSANGKVAFKKNKTKEIYYDPKKGFWYREAKNIPETRMNWTL